jgi:hypothetical protein
MADSGKLTESSDACPLAPGSAPPKKGLFDVLQNFYDRFFGNWKMVTLSLVLAGIVFGYSVATVPVPMVSLPVFPDSWNIPFTASNAHYHNWQTKRTPSYSNVRNHEGDLILEGTDVLLIQNMTFVLKGNMRVRDEAKLILRNGELLVNQRINNKKPLTPLDVVYYHHAIRFEDASTLLAMDSRITSLNGEISIGFFDVSQGSMSASDLRRVELHGYDHASIEVSGSSISQIVFGIAASINAFDCDIGWIGPLHDHRRGSWDNCSVVVTQSKVRDLELEFKDDARVTVSTPILGRHGFWNTYTNITSEGAAVNVTLLDTRVSGRVMLTTLDGDLEVEGLYGSYDIYGLKGSLRISDCVVDDVGAAKMTLVNDTVCNVLRFHDVGQCNVIESKVDIVHYQGFKGNVTYKDVLIEDVIIESYCDGFVEGSIWLAKEPIQQSKGSSGGITREFQVLVHDDGRAIKEVKLALYDTDKTLLWSGETNREGTADFSVRSVSYESPSNQDAIERRFNEPLMLEAKKDGVKKEAVVTFCINTPIVFDLDSSRGAAYDAGRRHLTVLSGSMIVFIIAGFSLYYLKSLTRPLDEFDIYVG